MNKRGGWESHLGFICGTNLEGTVGARDLGVVPPRAGRWSWRESLFGKKERTFKPSGEKARRITNGGRRLVKRTRERGWRFEMTATLRLGTAK